MLETHMFNDYQFHFLTFYIEFEKLLGDDDQNNVKHLYSEIKKKKENLLFVVSK